MTTKELHGYTESNLKGIKCIYVDKETVQGVVQFLDKRCENVKGIPNIQGCHHTQPYYDHKDIFVFKTSTDLLQWIECFQKVLRFAYSYKKTYEEVHDSTDSNETISETHDLFIPINRIDKSGIKLGMFVLVNTVSENKRPTSSNGKKKFPYVGICKSHTDNEEEVKITFLKVSDYIKNLQT